jgi:hypothetical protein
MWICLRRTLSLMWRLSHLLEIEKMSKKNDEISFINWLIFTSWRISKMRINFKLRRRRKWTLSKILEDHESKCLQQWFKRIIVYCYCNCLQKILHSCFNEIAFFFTCILIESIVEKRIFRFVLYNFLNDYFMCKSLICMFSLYLIHVWCESMSKCL